MIYIYGAIVLIGGSFGAYLLGQHFVRQQRAKERDEMRAALKRNIEQESATPPAPEAQAQAEDIIAS